MQTKIILEKLQTRCEIVSFNFQQQIFSFKHKSFAEFLYAYEKTNSFNFQIENILFIPFWQGVSFFYFGLKKDCTNEMTAILRFSPVNIQQELIKIWFTADYLLAGYMTPTRYIRAVLKQVIILTANIYLDSANFKKQTPLLSFSQLDLLAFLRFFLRQSYAYMFFASVLEDVCCDIVDDSSLTEEQQIVTLFLIGCILLELQRDGFCLLIEKFKDRIPNDIKVAIGFEYIQAETLNHIFRKQAKTIKKKWGKLITFNQVERLLKIPLLELLKQKSAKETKNIRPLFSKHNL